MESVEFLERIANLNEPPMNLEAIHTIRMEFGKPGSDKTTLQNQLRGMERIFIEERGNLALWKPEVLSAIDECFVRHYMLEGDPHASLFAPDNADNLNLFRLYVNDVDKVLRVHSSAAPRYARSYFAFYSIWQMQGFRFPMPLGTASVIEALNKILLKVKQGFSEVSIYFTFTRVRCSSRTNCTRAQRSSHEFDIYADSYRSRQFPGLRQWHHGRRRST